MMNMLDSTKTSLCKDAQVGFAVGSIKQSTWTLHITNCKEVKFTVDGIDITADIGGVDLSTYEAIEINGHRFERVNEKRK